MTKLLEVGHKIIDNTEGLLISAHQEIDQGLIDSVQTAYDNSLSDPMGDMPIDASVPMILIEKWRLEGFDAMSPGVSNREVIARLKREGLEKFIATKRRV